MTYQQVHYKGITKNISVCVIDNQEFVLLQDVHDIFPKITVLLSTDDDPIPYEKDDNGNRLLPLRVKAYLNDILVGYSPDDSDTSDNSQGTTGTKTMTTVTNAKETLLSIMTKLFSFLLMIVLLLVQLKSKFFSSNTEPSLDETALLAETVTSDEIVEKKNNITNEDIDELKKMNVEFVEISMCLNVTRPLILQEMESFSNVLGKGYDNVTGVTFESSIGDNKEATKIFTENLKVNSKVDDIIFNGPLRDDEIESVTDALKENEKVIQIEMIGIISDRTIELIVDALKINKNIQRVTFHAQKVAYFDEAPPSLGENKISATGAKAFASVFQIHEKLEQVNLSVNEISNEGAEYIAQALRLNEHVTSLDLSKNKISDDGAIAIAEALKINKSLTFLDLHGNQIGDRSAKAIGEMLSQNTTLEYFHLDRNKISDIGGKHIEKGLCENKKLAMFWLSDNQISDSVYNQMKIKVSEFNQSVSW
ncbi:unnamed protein product [Didymodactylos carnosus]|uniref:Uncharacterized protein n=1 Tax=Didymodactylos carnosus TaxID=1234261 RepID=A0A8S2Q093_9BILA|nr:unnamed protein product [Didymodactylos carnosus]CAF4071766.1 unnamed protein product [Didymodactylos carnosus]